MAVNLTASEVFTPITPIADALLGGGTGMDLGTITTSNYGPLIDKVANTGHQDLYLSHDGTNEITELKCFIQTFGVSTGFTYGGGSTAAADFTTMKSLGAASGSVKNNADGLSGGLWMEMDFDVSVSNRFDQASRPTLVKIFGDSGTDGQDLASAYDITVDSMVYDNSGETAATSPIAGQVGASGSATLGDRSHLQYRQFLPTSFTVGGFLQFELVFSFAFTT